MSFDTYPLISDKGCPAPLIATSSRMLTSQRIRRSHCLTRITRRRVSVATSASGQRCEPFRDGVAGATVTLCCLKPRPSSPPSVTGWMKCEMVLTDMMSAARTRYRSAMQKAYTRSLSALFRRNRKGCRAREPAPDGRPQCRSSATKPQAKTRSD